MLRLLQDNKSFPSIQFLGYVLIDTDMGIEDTQSCQVSDNLLPNPQSDNLIWLIWVEFPLAKNAKLQETLYTADNSIYSALLRWTWSFEIFLSHNNYYIECEYFTCLSLLR